MKKTNKSKDASPIFTYLNAILVTKKSNGFSLQGYEPLIVNRWLSFICPSFVPLINELNKTPYLSDKKLHFWFCLAVFPKLKRIPKFTYIKKQTRKGKKTNYTEQEIECLAKDMKISTKEVRRLFDEKLQLES